MRPDELERKRIVESGGLAVASLKPGADDALVNWARINGVYLYVGRAVPRRGLQASPLANPFRIGLYSREESIELYRHWLRLQPKLLGSIVTLAPRLLCCWCYPLSCHAEVIAEEAQRLAAATSELFDSTVYGCSRLSGDDTP
jgi:Domain of unknown function (DUF4326)